ncbi:hypothetical protein L195_g016451, partial [Trifolium pratense]
RYHVAEVECTHMILCRQKVQEQEIIVEEAIFSQVEHKMQAPTRSF